MPTSGEYRGEVYRIAARDIYVGSVVARDERELSGSRSRPSR
jgi:hypothetical protein